MIQLDLAVINYPINHAAIVLLTAIAYTNHHASMHRDCALGAFRFHYAIKDHRYCNFNHYFTEFVGIFFFVLFLASLRFIEQ